MIAQDSNEFDGNAATYKASASKALQLRLGPNAEKTSISRTEIVYQGLKKQTIRADKG
jgi:hypothetical protein